MEEFFKSDLDSMLEDDTEVEEDICICSECNGMFIVEEDGEIPKCPLCGTKFDTEPTLIET